jgi:hypothetical protein
MEIVHNVTDVTDFYNTLGHPGRFEEMAAAAGTHPTSYTKNELGWIGPVWWMPMSRFEARLATHPGQTKRYNLYAVGLPSKRSLGRVRGVKVQAKGSNRYLVVEARIKDDRWDRGGPTSSSEGIPSEGVVVYEFAPEGDPWPKIVNPGPWSPLQLRTPTALTVGENFRHHDTWTGSGGPADNRTGVGRIRVVTVVAAVTGGFNVEISADG